MIKYGVLIGMISVLTSCFSEKVSECDESQYWVGDYYSRPIEKIEPINGLSCEEFLSRQEVVPIDSNKCMSSVVFSDTNQNDEVIGSQASTMSAQNTVISNIKEGRFLVYNERLSFLSEEKYIYAHDLTSIKKEPVKIKYKGHERSKLILYNDYLIVYGTSIEIFNISNLNNIKKIKELKGLGSLEVKLRGSHLHIYAQNSDLPTNVKCEEIYYIDDATNRSLITKYEINLDHDDLYLKVGLSLYGVRSHHLDEDGEYFYKSYGKDTQILKQSGETLLSNSFEGYIPGAFAIKEYGSYLAAFVSKRESSSLIIFDEHLTPVNEISQIARGERIYSSRFTKDKGYLVTFRRVDPLFTFDLSDILNPKLVGELKIPGVSRYLHPLKEDYLLGVGSSVTNWGDVEFSLFNVGELSMPQKVDSIILEGIQFTDSFRDHHYLTKYNDYIVIISNDYPYYSSYNSKSIIVLKHDGDKLINIGNIKDLKSNSEILIKDKVIYLFETNRTRLFSLEEGIPEIE